MQRHTCLPAWFIITRRHRRNLRMNGDESFERSFRLWFCHFRIDLGQNSDEQKKVSKGFFFIFYIAHTSYLVFPSAHSTHPSSGPNVNVGVRISSGDRPSSLKDSLRALKRNSLSGIEGEGGLIFK